MRLDASSADSVSANVPLQRLSAEILEIADSRRPETPAG